MNDKTKIELEELLDDLEEYMNQRADVDADDHTKPNEEMRFQNRIDVMKIKILPQKVKTEHNVQIKINTTTNGNP